MHCVRASIPTPGCFTPEQRVRRARRISAGTLSPGVTSHVYPLHPEGIFCIVQQHHAGVRYMLYFHIGAMQLCWPHTRTLHYIFHPASLNTSVWSRLTAGNAFPRSIFRLCGHHYRLLWCRRNMVSPAESTIVELYTFSSANQHSSGGKP